jgi:hypothetical protein
MLKLLLYGGACACTIATLFYNPTPLNLVIFTAFLCCAAAITAWMDFMNDSKEVGIKIQVFCWTLCAVFWTAQLIISIV